MSRSSIITEMRPIHPGEHLREDFLPDYGMNADDFACRLGAEGDTVADLLAETGTVTPSLALRLARLFRTSPEFWLNLQRDHDLKRARDEAGDTLDVIEPLDA